MIESSGTKSSTGSKSTTDPTGSKATTDPAGSKATTGSKSTTDDSTVSTATGSKASTDDYTNGTKTTGTVAVGSSATGTLETAGDADWFKVYLQADSYYKLEAMGASSSSGSLLDPHLQLFDSAGTLLTSDDDTGAGVDALLQYVAPQSDYYYIGVTATAIPETTIANSKSSIDSSSKSSTDTGSKGSTATDLANGLGTYKVQVTEIDASSLVGGLGEGNGVITGTTKIETVAYNMPYSAVTISHSDAGTKESSDDSFNIAYSQSSGASKATAGNDTLRAIERIKFSDGVNIALDVVSPDQSAGAALALLYAGFGSLTDTTTLGQWIYAADSFSTAGGSKTTGSTEHARVEYVADAILDYYVPGGVSNEAVVEILYANVVGKAPSQAEKSYFVGLLNNGTYTQAGLYAMAAELEMNTAHYVDVVGQGVQYTPYSGSKA